MLCDVSNCMTQWNSPPTKNPRNKTETASTEKLDTMGVYTNHGSPNLHTSISSGTSHWQFGD